jgi:cytochrome P450
MTEPAGVLPLAPVPAHVPRELVRDFNYFTQQPVDGEIHLAWKKLHEGPEIFWTPHNGGHWVATRAEDLEEMYRDHARFSSRHMAIPVAGMSDLPIHPVDADPPEHTAYRNLMMPAFLPKEIARLEVKARELSIARIESFRERGECEFVSEFTKYMPIGIFLSMTGLPPEDALQLLPAVDRKTREPDPALQLEAWNTVVAYVEARVRERVANPGDDMISRFLRGTIDGRPISQRHALGMCVLAMFAGLDTVVAMLGHAMRFIAENPAHRQLLIDEPALIPQAVEELLRRYSVVTDAREIAADFEYRGIAFRKGDMILLPTMLHGLDERRYPDPLRVDFRRGVKFHLAFGNGVHRCIGSMLARTELRVMLQEWLPRIPDFAVRPDAALRFQAGQVSVLCELPLVWDPARTNRVPARPLAA